MELLVTVESAIAEVRAGRMVVIVDDADREDEGDLALAAQFVTTEAINFLASEARGLICMPIVGERLDALAIPLLSPRTSRDAAAFTMPVDARDGVASGISAADRARTVQVLLDPNSEPSDLASPGHLFPLRYAEGGVLSRAGHTEASVDLAALAGCYPAAVICEVMNTDGTMARLPDLLTFARRSDLAVVSVAELIRYRRARPEHQLGGWRLGAEPSLDFRSEPRLHAVSQLLR